MSDFIETLRSIGGIKPCDCGVNGISWNHKPGVCAHCHGTGQVLDLAPLLARPEELHQPVYELIERMIDPRNRPAEDAKQFATPFVVGPQRAHSLVYEIARQLGGTCAVWASGVGYDGEPVGGSLSLPIPDGATVLFVTDRYDSKSSEIRDIAHEIDGPLHCFKGIKALPYLLCLITNRDRTMEFEIRDEHLLPQICNVPVISLHQEK